MEKGSSDLTPPARTGSAARLENADISSLSGKTAKSPDRLDFAGQLLFKRRDLLKVDETLATDRDRTGYEQIPEVNIRQRVAPSGAFWLCVLFSDGKDPTFRSTTVNV